MRIFKVGAKNKLAELETGKAWKFLPRITNFFLFTWGLKVVFKPQGGSLKVDWCLELVIVLIYVIQYISLVIFSWLVPGKLSNGHKKVNGQIFFVFDVDFDSNYFKGICNWY